MVNGKPHPEPYLRGAAMIDAAPQDCVVVEDAPSGVGAGKAAGCRVLGVVGTHTAEQLKAAGADWVVASLLGVKAELVGPDTYDPKAEHDEFERAVAQKPSEKCCMERMAMVSLPSASVSTTGSLRSPPMARMAASG